MKKLNSIIAGIAMLGASYGTGAKMPTYDFAKDFVGYSNWSSPDKKKEGIIVHYKNDEGNLEASETYLRCNSKIEDKAFGVFIPKTRTLLLDFDRNGTIDRIIENMERGRLIHTDAPNCPSNNGKAI